MSLTDPDNHQRTIIHLDIDCFYAQVEMVADPSLAERPLGIQQKNIVVTCNYVARGRGVGKCMYVKEAVSLCPDLVLVNGEDLARYRKVSSGVYGTLVKATECEVERLGMDENWVDVSRMVEARIREGYLKVSEKNVMGVECEENCGCEERLMVGSMIARELRELIRSEHRLTCSAGVSYNKLLAKVGGGVNKPDNQTVVGPAGVGELLGRLNKVTSIPGVGRKMGELLEEAGVISIDQLKLVGIEMLEKAGIAKETGRGIIGLAWGRDDAPVKMSGKVGVIGLEDRFMGIYDKEGIRDKLVWLLNRLSVLLGEDGRKATTVKVTVRDYFKDKLVKKFSKECRQRRVPPRLLVVEGGQFKPNIMQELVEVCLVLVNGMVNMGQQFHITLLGVAVTDFVEQAEMKKSIKNFFSPKKSIVDTEHKLNNGGDKFFQEDESLSECKIIIEESVGDEVGDGDISTSPVFRRASQRSSDLNSTPRNLFSNSAGLSNEPQPPVKGSIFSMSNNNKRSLSELENQNLLLTKKSKTSSEVTFASEVKAKNPSALACPAEYDTSVWDALPDDIKRDIIYNLKPSEHPHPPVLLPDSDDIECPPDIDHQVFCQLPENIKKELVLNHKAKVTPKSKSSQNSIKNYFSPK